MKLFTLSSARSLMRMLSTLIPLTATLTLRAAGGEVDKNTSQTIPAPAEEESFIEKLWSLPVLYRDSKNPVLQELSFIGRYHGQWHSTRAQDGRQEGWEDRRARLGLQAKLLRHFTFESEFNLGWSDGAGNFFEDVDTATIKSARGDFYTVVGKQKAKITQEYSTSANKILTFERSLLVNQIVPEKVGGIVMGRKSNHWLFEGGLYSGSLSEDMALPEWSGGFGWSSRIAYYPRDNSEIRLDFLHMDESSGNDGFSSYDNILSLNTTNTFGRWGINGDLLFASGAEEQPDVYGLMAMPSYALTKKLRAVFRYHFAGSGVDDAIRLQKRYEIPALGKDANGRGCKYHSFYAGLNYYIYEDKLKLMSGVEYSRMGGATDYSGWTFLIGCRLYF